jgi:AraC family transcriptional regulator
LHPPSPRLPEGVVARGGRQKEDLLDPFTVPAFVEDLLIIHLRIPKRLSIKLDRWIHAESKPGDIVIIPRGAACIWDGDGMGEALILSLPPALSVKTARLETYHAPAHIEFIPRIGHADPLIHAVGQAILGELQTEGLFGTLYLESLFRTLTLHLLRNHAVFTPKETTVKGNLSAEALGRVYDYVQAYLDQEITLEAMAALVHLSPYHFARKFKETTGIPPYQYVLHCRVERAKTLLAAGKDSIGDVAQMVGFANQSHLTRHIKSTLGVTPGELLPKRKNRQQ